MRLPGFLRRWRKALAVPAAPGLPLRKLEVRIAAGLFRQVRERVEDFSRGEEAGFLICSLGRLADRDVLLAREWHPIPDSALQRATAGSVLSWGAAFNSEILARAIELDATPVLVHSHGGPAPRFSDDDRAKERPLFGAFSRITEPLPTGTLLLGSGDAVGSFWRNGRCEQPLHHVVIVGETIEIWPATGVPAAPEPARARARLDRQSLAIGPASDAKLAQATVAVLGLSGGGSHVAGQLAHQGVGTIVPIDDETVDETNLGRLIGATEGDVDRTLKVDVAERVIAGIDSSIRVIKIDGRFPSARTIELLREADVIVSCVDRLDAREAINAFARRYLIPHVDVGIAIRSAGERLASADGQVIASLPGHACMRCWFLTDADLRAEREQAPPGYDRNPDAPGEAQVVSMNGVLASEACNCVLDLITGYSGGRRGARVWQYEGRSGQLEQCELPSRRPGCPACAQEGHGDPAPARTNQEV
jgi:molybdopterin/thiamine biosynthesis adenylyltransferase